jgi:medium-chain acyl-[acyl-carrier-protein] hydrolase
MDGLAGGAPVATPVARPERWGVRWRPAADVRVRLFCLPHTGGGAAAYRAWASCLPADIEVVAVRLPGRETRFRERPFDRLDDLVSALVHGLEPLMDRPFAWFGHSMGALVAYEACRAMRESGGPQPVRLLVSGRRAPHLPDRYRPVHDAPTADVVARLVELNGTPREVLDDRAALSTFLPMLRADFAVSETYDWAPGPPLNCPISVFGGLRDPMTTPEELHAWKRHSSVGCRVRTFEGDHFFLHTVPERVLPAIDADLRSTRADAGRGDIEGAL